jgi:group II intron reverse transcriptase/maturase/CRISPR-associated endonuclease Cas1
MFIQSLEKLFSKKNLLLSLELINKKSVGIDTVTFEDVEFDKLQFIQNLHDDLMNNKWIPEPLKGIEINKADGKKRPITLSSIKDKLVAKTLAYQLGQFFDPIFSHHSFGYRPNKNIQEAIKCARSYIKQGNTYFYKGDVSNFFETISHNKLLTILDKHLQDKRLIRCITLLIDNGVFSNNEYKSHAKGIHQGDSLSPLLSNIYLHLFDTTLETKSIKFLRFADDFLCFSKTKENSIEVESIVNNTLANLNLTVSTEKSYQATSSEGVVFLGIELKNNLIHIKKKTLHKMFDNLHNIANSTWSFLEKIHLLNQEISYIKMHYYKIISKGSMQREQLQENLIDALSVLIAIAKTNKEIKTKSDFRLHLHHISWFVPINKIDEKHLFERIINRGYEKFHAEKVSPELKRSISSKKQHYAAQIAHNTFIHISTPGLSLGISKNRFTIKEKGKIRKSIPSSHIERIIIHTKGVFLSSNVIDKCATFGISIEFIDYKHNPYAMLYSYKSALPHHIIQQAEVAQSDRALELAKTFIISKSKNQLNYLKYLNKHHSIDNKIFLTMKENIKKMKTVDTNNLTLMGYEGINASLYWQQLANILDDEYGFEGRVTKGAKDIVNSSLNYAYALLYGKIQKSLIQAGLNLHLSFLHSQVDNKPTLVYDMIEEFRTFVVDRTVISLFNRKEPMQLDNRGYLNKKSRELIVKNIFERLGSYTQYHKESRKIDNIIVTQSYQLASAIFKGKKYRGFIGKF